MATTTTAGSRRVPAVEDPMSTRARILDAALAAFAIRGVEATSLDALAAEIGIRKQTILYWFPSKEQVLLGVIDHAVAELGARLGAAATAARHPRGGGAGAGAGGGSAAAAGGGLGGEAGAGLGGGGGSLVDQVAAVVDATFRLGSTDPQLLALVREVTRVGPPASAHLATALEPLVAGAASALAAAGGAGGDVERVRRVLVDAGARVVGMATEAEVRADLGLAPDVAWLRSRRRTLVDAVTTALTHP
jgi:TetR/AcrR family transcriptional regulator